MIFITFIIVILAVLLLFILSMTVGDFLYASRGGKFDKSDHYDGEHFINIGWTKRESYRVESYRWKYNKIRAFFKWFIFERRTKWSQRPIIQAQPKKHVPEGTCEITFIWHASVLIQIDGINIITDPVWSERISPISWIGPKRYMDVWVDFDKLPKIDIVLISHNHYDHMDIPTLQELEKRDSPKIYTGLWNKKYLEDRKISHVYEMDWWESLKQQIWKSIIDITFLPAQHFSARWLSDKNRTLWWGFAITLGNRCLYFAWDTGYWKCIHAIAERFPTGFDIGLIPIGAYKPRWFMAEVHTNPEEAMKIQKELNIQTGIGIHWWTFPLADDSQDGPLIDLAKAQEKDEYKNLDFRVGPNGTVWSNL